MAKVLKVRCVEGALVHNLDALQAHQLKFVGRKFDKVTKSWLPVPEGETVPFRAEYVQAVKSGELEPLDKETCRLCGVPTFLVSK